MKYTELKVGLKVKDRWFPEFGTGKITKVLKTYTQVKFANTAVNVTYDKGHVQFLDRVGK
jgi:hypothetical protein